ncbi:MAG TPA: hypothetical protein VGH86_04510 [Phenylobacterium sp.]
MVPAKPSVAFVALAALLLLGACNVKPMAKAGGDAGAAEDPGYIAPPMPDGLHAVGAGWRLLGSAPPEAQVRLATPQGEALSAVADGQGRWAIALGPSSDARIFGLSATIKGRQIQSEGYLVVAPTGEAAVLRAGAGARRIDAGRSAGLRAIDFDRGGGLQLTAAGPPGATLIIRLDGRQVAEGRTDASGHYEVSVPPAGAQAHISTGAHEAQVFGDGIADTVSFQVTPAEPLAEGPLRSQLTPAGPRVDWMTPGGGVQSTILIH